MYLMMASTLLRASRLPQDQEEFMFGNPEFRQSAIKADMCNEIVFVILSNGATQST